MVTWSNSAGRLTGRDFSIAASIRLKIAVFAPMPSASDRVATEVSPGLPRRARRA